MLTSCRTDVGGVDLCCFFLCSQDVRVWAGLVKYMWRNDWSAEIEKKKQNVGSWRIAEAAFVLFYFEIFLDVDRFRGDDHRLVQTEYIFET